MSTTLIVTRSRDRNFNETGKTIGLDDWKALVAQDAELRLRTEPYEMRNPATGEMIRMRVGAGDAEFNNDGQWVPLLRHHDGELRTRLVEDYLDPTNPVRRKIVQVAGELSALITHDAGDEILDW